MTDKPKHNSEIENNIMDDIENCVKNFLNDPEKSFVINEYIILPMGDEIKGFLGEYQNIIIKFQERGINKNMYVFVKLIPTNKEQAKHVEKYGCFQREVDIFSQIFPKFKKRNVDDMFSPRCFLIKKNKLYLEDMNQQGYKNTNNRISLDDKHCYLALSQIAKFHAESIILEEHKSNNYKIDNEFHSFLNNEGFIYEGWYSTGLKAALEASKLSAKLKSISDLTLFENNWRKFFKDTLKLCSPSKYTRNVLCHRDLWSNNLMFQCDEKGNPIQCVLIDFQMCGCMPPAGDVMTFIYLNIMDERRDRNLEDFLKYYYQILRNEISQQKLNLEDLIPWNEFRKSCEEYKKLGLMYCAIVQQFTLLNSEEAKIIFGNSQTYKHLMEESRTDVILNFIKTDPVFKEKFMYSIDEIIDLCL